ncbi:molybdenum ABC transporter ATPase [Neisseria arctica]|uniref:Molybdenum ABC transporter ATPase n=1 Tax=Neisseria arctica TaxID=1470200 RepID=A0A0J0YU30_9NEIS|nr:ATP-binding cassette domain-containing protein [Neisseria arctica]KLT73605.1 molybdenum ABC transporter ATPase [Neisseria arctica]UOO85727.1 ATP-binding cassette domain-containing protein [Neisseria arctica]
MQFDIDIEKNFSGFSLAVKLATNAEKLALIGASGAGKSLTLQILAGLLAPDAGHIKIDGEIWFDSETNINLPIQQRKAGLVFQDYALFPHLTVAQNIGFGLQQGWRNPGKRPSEEVAFWLDILKIGHIANKLPSQISGGQKQRTALARALAVKPRLLLLDEPFSALDTDLRKHTREELALLQAQTGVPMILITHDKADAHALAEETWQMENGRVYLK